MLTLGGLEYAPQFDDVRLCKQISSGKKKEFVHTSSSSDFLITSSMPVHSPTNVGTTSSDSSGPNINCATSKADCMVIELGDFGENGGEKKGGCGDTSAEGLSKECIGNYKASANVECTSRGGDDEGTELEVMQRSEMTCVPKYTSQATFEVGGKNVSSHDADIDAPVNFSVGILQFGARGFLQKGGTMNGLDQNPLQLASSYNSVKCFTGPVSSNARDDRTATSTKGHDTLLKRASGVDTAKSSASIHNSTLMQMPHVTFSPTPWITSLPAESAGRVSFHGGKDFSGDNKNKSLDENGNAVNRLESSTSNERKSKARRSKTNNGSNFIMSQNIEGYRGDKDLDSLIKFIEPDTENKGKSKNSSATRNGPLNFKQRINLRKEDVGSKPRRDRGGGDEDDEKSSKAKGGKQMSKENRNSNDKGGKLKKSNSLEEISKSKLEDLTSYPDNNNEAVASVVNPVLVKRPKKQATLDDGDFFGEMGHVGDRRSWGTEEGQQYYCNDSAVTVSADEGVSGGRKRRGGVEDRRRTEKEEAIISTAAEDTGFLVIETKKQRRKKRRSSSGGRSGGGGQYNPSQYPTYYQSRDNNYHQKKGLSAAASGFPPHDRTMEPDGSNSMLYQYRHRPRSPDHHRRKSTSSMPPSDKSDSSDLDSVHSLPVSSTTPKLTLDQTSTSSGSTPQASYADITRMASAPPQGAYGNINFNSNKWPAVAVPKGVVISPPSASNVVHSNNNPQFITGPKLNIGVPPVSGSKASSNPISPNSNCSSANSSQSNIHPSGPANSVTSDDAPNQIGVAREAELAHVSDSEIAPLSSVENCLKKDAMTNTIDLKPSSLAEERECSSKQVLKSQGDLVNILLNSEYPSLEESLISDKNERKLPKVGTQNFAPVHFQSLKSAVSLPLTNQTVVLSQNNMQQNRTISPVNEIQQKTASTNSVLSNAQTQSVVTTPIQGVSGDNPLQCLGKSAPTQPQSSSVVPSIKNNETQNFHSIMNSCSDPKEVTCAKIKTSNRKVSSSSRPPVIMDDSEGGSLYGESVSTLSELTFGFEVNEQLLLSDGEEASPDLESRPHSTDTQIHLEDEEEDEQETSQDTEIDQSTDSGVQLEKSSRMSNAGDDFSARFREPGVQAGNYDKIVDFVGLAWDDVLKEISSSQLHSGAKVQYYRGQ